MSVDSKSIVVAGQPSNLVSTSTTGSINAKDPVVIFLMSVTGHTQTAYRNGLNRIAWHLFAARDHFNRDLFRIEYPASSSTAFAGINWEKISYTEARLAFNLLLQRGAISFSSDGTMELSPVAAATYNQSRVAFRGVIRECFTMSLLDADTYQRLNLLEQQKVRNGRTSYASAEEVNALIEHISALPESNWRSRDLALIALLFGAGLRRNELATLKMVDIDFSNNALLIRGKGEKERVTALDKGAAKYLKGWLSRRKDEDALGEFVFSRVFKGGKIGEDCLSDFGIFSIVAARCLEAGMRVIGPHEFRHGHVTTLLDAGLDINYVSQNVGHSSTETTKRYDQRGVRNRVEKISTVTLVGRTTE